MKGTEPTIRGHNQYLVPKAVVALVAIVALNACGDDEPRLVKEESAEACHSMWMGRDHMTAEGRLVELDITGDGGVVESVREQVSAMAKEMGVDGGPTSEELFDVLDAVIPAQREAVRRLNKEDAPFSREYGVDISFCYETTVGIDKNGGVHTSVEASKETRQLFPGQ